MSNKIYYDVLSPDGFSIKPSEKYSSPKQAFEATLQWAKQYERQGYYSSMDYGKILVIDLPDFCKLIRINDKGLML